MAIFEKVQSAYDQIVMEFAKRNHFHMAANLVALAERLVAHVGKNGRIVEVGCGTGRDMAWFEAQGLSVKGLDLSTGMLAYARDQVDGDLSAMNMCNLGFRNEYFDGAWCCASLLHLPKDYAPNALREIYRVMKPNGMLVLSIQKGDTEGWEPGYVSNAERYFARYQVDEMEGMLSENGFCVSNMDTSPGTNNRSWLAFVCNRK
jgi:ubiquinone/menaquinone biosynthesis C-methylase UbiE